MTVLRRAVDGYTYKGDLDLVVMTCPCCGVTYAIPHRLQQNAYERGEGQIQWYCPNGHQLGYHGEGEDERKRKKAEADARWYSERLTAERDLREHTEHKLRAQKGATTKAKKRHAAGVCPCCSRTFQQLQRHMANKHPDYDPAKDNGS